MQREDGVAGKALEQAVFDHGARARLAAFLGGLEDAVDGAVELGVMRQVPGGGKQDGGVAVVAAGVHAVVVLRLVRKRIGFGHGQRVHVGAQADTAGTRAACQRADHAGAADARRHLPAPGGQLARHQGSGAMFFKADFGMRVQVAADGAKRGVGADRAEYVLDVVVRVHADP
ncbi:hypothetical protein D3C73_1240030 [compost metagenome]